MWSLIIFKEGKECVLYLMGLFIVLEPAYHYCVQWNRLVGNVS